MSHRLLSTVGLHSHLLDLRRDRHQFVKLQSVNQAEYYTYRAEQRLWVEAFLPSTVPAGIFGVVLIGCEPDSSGLPIQQVLAPSLPANYPDGIVPADAEKRMADILVKHWRDGLT